MSSSNRRVVLEAIEPRVLFNAADLDPTFGAGGKALIDSIDRSNDQGSSILRQSDGKLLVSGGTGHDSFLTRYSSAGALDPTFGSGGSVNVNFGAAYSGINKLLGFTATGGFYAYGARSTTASSGTRTQLLIKFLPTGQLDTSFGTAGTLALPASLAASAATLQPDGKLLVLGHGTNSLIALARYNADGTADTTFGSGGQFTDPSISFVSANAVAVQSDGKIIVGLSYLSTQSFDYSLIRYTAAGARDTTFGTSGITNANFVGLDAKPRSVLFQTDGKIVVGSDNYTSGAFQANRWGAVRFTSAGVIDTTFDTDGYQTLDPVPANETDTMYGYALDGANRMIFVGAGDPTSVMQEFVVRLTAAGAMDTTFDGDGITFAPQPANVFDRIAIAPLILPDNRITTAGVQLAAAGYPGEPDVLVSQFTTAGAVDSTFGTAGHTVNGFTGTVDSNVPTAVILPNGKVVAVALPGSYYGVQFTQVNQNGAADATFGTNGTTILGKPGAGMLPSDVIAQPDGKLLATGWFQPDAHGGSTPLQFLIARVNANGTPDTTIGGGTGVAGLDVGNGQRATASAAAVQADGKILILGTRDEPATGNSIPILSRATAAGVLDTTFGTGGYVVLSPPNAGSLSRMLIRADGRILVAGTGGTGVDALVGLLDPATGAPDPQFGTNGYATLDFGTSSDVLRDVLFTPFGKILVAGITGSGTTRAYAVGRMTATGAPDTTFSNGAAVRSTALGSTRDLLRTALQRDGKILAAGSLAGATAPARDFLAARFNGDGTIDTTFGQSGFATVDVSPGSVNWGGDSASRIAQNADGTILLAGMGSTEVTDRDVAVARLVGTPPDLAPPTVVDAQFLFDAPTPRVQLTFNEDVGDSLVAGDLVVTNTTTGATVPTGSVSVQYNAASFRATFTFPGYTGNLPTGRYTAKLPANSISDASGNALASDYTLNFSVLAADGNRDGHVDLTDFTILAANFNASGKTFSQGNFDYDANGMVDLTDFTILAANFNTSLPASAATATAMPVATTATAPAPAFTPPTGHNRLIDDLIT